MYFYESCTDHVATIPSFFIFKLKNIQVVCKKLKKCPIKIDNLSQNEDLSSNENCIQCTIDFFYIVGNIIWPNNIIHIISHGKFPSKYFINCILMMEIFDNYIINPPIELDKKTINKFHIIPFHHNKLLILEALLSQGSKPDYIVADNKCMSKLLNSSDPNNITCHHLYIYSEHSGGISIENMNIADIIVSTQSNRLSKSDEDIYLPTNDKLLAKYPYIYHSHPITGGISTRGKMGIVYEFPSASDIFNFIKYHNDGIAQSSLIVSPEGLYNIRPIYYSNHIKLDGNLLHNINASIMKIEKLAQKKYSNILDNSIDENTFNNNIGSDMQFIKMYNKIVRPLNIFVEYYPRQFRNSKWSLRQIFLQYIK